MVVKLESFEKTQLLKIAGICTDAVEASVRCWRCDGWGNGAYGQLFSEDCEDCAGRGSHPRWAVEVISAGTRKQRRMAVSAILNGDYPHSSELEKNQGNGMNTIFLVVVCHTDAYFVTKWRVSCGDNPLQAAMAAWEREQDQVKAGRDWSRPLHTSPPRGDYFVGDNPHTRYE